MFDYYIYNKFVLLFLFCLYDPVDSLCRWTNRYDLFKVNLGLIPWGQLFWPGNVCQYKYIFPITPLNSTQIYNAYLTAAKQAPFGKFIEY